MSHKEFVVMEKRLNSILSVRLANIVVGVILGILISAPLLLLYLVKSDLTFAGYYSGGRLGSPNFVIEYETFSILISPEIEEDVRESIEEELGGIEYEGRKRFEFLTESGVSSVDSEKNSDAESADIVVKYSASEGEFIVNPSMLLPVGHFYWIDDDVRSDEIRNYDAIYVDSDSYNIAKPIFKELFDVDILSSEDLASTLKNKEGKVIGFTDASRLNFNEKLLSLDGEYFLEEFDKGGIQYGLAISGDSPEFIKDVVEERISELLVGTGSPLTKDSVAKINMTGVTAISRDLAFSIERTGRDGYPAEKIADFLKDADLTHTSNEVSFVPGCVSEQSLRFCSHPDYIKALKDSGVDIIELTGNHNNDYGAVYNTSTIGMYEELGWEYFGGGVDDVDAAKVLYKEVKGSKVAFLGYNYYDSQFGGGALATAGHAGANSFTFTKLQADITAAKKKADIVIVDFQFQECYSYPPADVIYPICYKPLAAPDQKGVFRKAVDYGADIVIGTQAHQPQTYEVYKGKPIFYGLGNLFFDQIEWIGTRQGLVLSHYFYNGSLIQTRINTTLYDNDMQTYISEGDDRKLLLELLAEARE